MAHQPLELAVESIEFYMRNVHLRLPFRYGKAELVSAPLLHTRMQARSGDGARAIGVSADMLPPKWFDKSPEKTYRQNIDDLLLAARIGAEATLEAASESATPFAVWRRAYDATIKKGHNAGLNGLTSAFGSSICERAMLDAAGKLAGLPFHIMVHENRFGMEPAAIHPELVGRNLADAFPSMPRESIFIRHTVGLADPILGADIDQDDLLSDGIPQSLEAWIKNAGIRYFKIKVQGDIAKDATRLRNIAETLNLLAHGDYRVTLDGNEQFKTGAAFADWFNSVAAEPDLLGFLDRVIFIEQPIERGAALTDDRARGFAATESMPPVIIDESDDALDAFKSGVALGYKGTSFKNCKGVFQGLMNKMLVDLYNEDEDSGFILSGEDLCNQPIIPLQQDLCVLSVLGVDNAERNGHHYGGNLDHLSDVERVAALEVHGDLYEANGSGAKLKIRDGAISLRSLTHPGFGVGIETDFSSMSRVADWQFDSLGLVEEPQ